MNCKNCGLELKEDAKFCPGCGQNAVMEAVNEETSSDVQQAEPEMTEPETTPEQPKKKKWVLPVVIAAAVVMLGVLAILIFGSGKAKIVGTYDVVKGYIMEDGEVTSSSNLSDCYLTMNADGTFVFDIEEVVDRKMTGTWEFLKVDDDGDTIVDMDFEDTADGQLYIYKEPSDVGHRGMLMQGFSSSNVLSFAIK